MRSAILGTTLQPTAKALSLLVLLFLSTSMAFPCECLGTPTVGDAIRASSAVFLGRAIAIKRDSRWMHHDQIQECGFAYKQEGLEQTLCQDSRLQVTFAVLSAWKGIAAPIVIVHTEAQRPACGYEVDFNDTHLVYADRNLETGELEVSLCSRSGPLQERRSDLAELGEPVYRAWGGNLEYYPISGSADDPDLWIVRSAGDSRIVVRRGCGMDHCTTTSYLQWISTIREREGDRINQENITVQETLLVEVNAIVGSFVQDVEWTREGDKIVYLLEVANTYLMDAPPIEVRVLVGEPGAYTAIIPQNLEDTEN